MRVLYLHPFSEAVSGPDESLLLLLEHLRGAVQSTVALPSNHPFIDRYLAVGADVLPGPVSRLRRFRTVSELGLYSADFVRSTARLLRAARGHRFDLIHANMEVTLEAALLSRWLGVPCVFHYRGNTSDDPRIVFDGLTWLWERAADHLFVVSEACAEVFRRRGRDARVEVLYNAVRRPQLDPSFDRAAARSALGIPSDGHLILTVGRLHPRKDLETFLRAAARVMKRSDCHFRVIGSAHGEEGAAYERRIRGLASDLALEPVLRFLGARADVEELLAASDLLVMTSRHEGFGRSVAEAMAAGLPTVLTREGAYPELIADGVHGLLAEPGDPDSFARAIATLLDDSVRRRDMGRAARRRATERFDADVQARRVLDVYASLTGNASVGGR